MNRSSTSSTVLSDDTTDDFGKDVDVGPLLKNSIFGASLSAAATGASPAGVI